MTTGRAIHHKDDAAFRGLLTDPALRAATAAAADSIMRIMQSAWPEFAREPTLPGVEVFERRSYTMADGRPSEWVMVNHPYAAAWEGRAGFITKSVAAAGGKLTSR